MGGGLCQTDIDSFAGERPRPVSGRHVETLPELNAALRSRESYSIRDFRQALQKWKRS